MTLTRTRGNHWLKQPDNTNSRRLANHTMRTALEAAAEYGQLTRKNAERVLAEHGLTWDEAFADLGDSTLDAVELCKWIGY